jgi:hypothetical protein
MARRAQPYRLSGAVTPRMVEQIDEMFQLLFDDTHNGTMDIRASQLRSGILTVPRGGTGIGEYVIGDLLYASDIDELSTLADVAAGSYLRSGGVGAAPVWSTVILPNTATTGDLWYASASNVMSALADVAAGAYLRSGGVATAPVWSSITLPNSAAVGDLWYASTTSAITALASVSAGSYLRSAGVSTAPVWSTVKIPNTATTGDLWYASASNTLSALASVAAGSYLRSAGVTTAPVWSTTTLPNTATTGDLWYASASNVMTALASVSAGSYLRSAGTTTAPVWSTVKIPNTATTGDLWYASASNTLSALAAVAAGSYLRSAGTSTAPVWSSITLPNTAAVGDLWYASTTGAMTALADVAAGSYLRSGGVNTAPVWSTLTLPNTIATGELLVATGTNIVGVLASGAGSTLLVSNGLSTVPGWTAWTAPSSVAQGDIWYGSGLNTLSALAKNTSATRYLSNTGTSNNPAWAQIDLSNGITGTLPVSHLVNGTTTTFVENTQTGSQNNWDLGTAVIGNTGVLWNGASTLTITGIAAPAASGVFFTFKNITSAQWAYFAHNSGSSSAANRLRNFVTSDAIPVGPGGSATWMYDALNGFWRMVGFDQGSWFTPAYASGDFTGNASMTWTVDSGDVTTDRYYILGTFVIYQFYYQSTSVGGTPSTDLRRALPTLLTPKTASEIVSTWGRNLDNGTANDGFTFTFGTGGLFFTMRRDKTSGNWAASTNNTSIQGTHIWELA